MFDVLSFFPTKNPKSPIGNHQSIYLAMCFNLTPDSVNSMLIRLEQRGFIKRIPGKARAIQLDIHPDCIPKLELPFKF